MTDKKYQILTPLRLIRSRLKSSERELSARSQVSRVTLRAAESGLSSLSVHNYGRVSEALDHEIALVSWPQDSQRQPMHSEVSTVAVALKVEAGGFESWKCHFFELVDEFRRTLDVRLILLPPPTSLDRKLRALLASMVDTLCLEAGMETPSWALRPVYLDQPWFLSGIENLKAMALLESPLPFKRNNIFVLENFLKRA